MRITVAWADEEGDQFRREIDAPGAVVPRRGDVIRVGSAEEGFTIGIVDVATWTLCASAVEAMILLRDVEHVRAVAPPPAPVSARIPIPADRITTSVRAPITFDEDPHEDPEREQYERWRDEIAAIAGEDESLDDVFDHAIGSVAMLDHVLARLQSWCDDPDEHADAATIETICGILDTGLGRDPNGRGGEEVPVVLWPGRWSDGAPFDLVTDDEGRMSFGVISVPLYATRTQRDEGDAKVEVEVRAAEQIRRGTKP